MCYAVTQLKTDCDCDCEWTLKAIIHSTSFWMYFPFLTNIFHLKQPESPAKKSGLPYQYTELSKSLASLVVTVIKRTVLFLRLKPVCPFPRFPQCLSHLCGINGQLYSSPYERLLHTLIFFWLTWRKSLCKSGRITVKRKPIHQFKNGEAVKCLQNIMRKMAQK